MTDSIELPGHDSLYYLAAQNYHWLLMRIGIRSYSAHLKEKCRGGHLESSLTCEVKVTGLILLQRVSDASLSPNAQLLASDAKSHERELRKFINHTRSVYKACFHTVTW